MRNMTTENVFDEIKKNGPVTAASLAGIFGRFDGRSLNKPLSKLAKEGSIKKIGNKWSVVE